jgi:hypothetical protein
MRKPPARGSATQLPANDSNLDFLLQQLDFAPENVVQAAATQPRLFLQAADFRIQCMRKAVAAKHKFEMVRAERELSIRKSARDLGDKMTEGHINATLTVDPKVVEAQEHLNQMDVEEAYGKLMLAGYYQRNDVVDVIARLTGAERAMEKIVENQKASLQDTKRKLDERYGRS